MVRPGLPRPTNRVRGRRRRSRAAHTAAAENRGLLRDAARLYKQAAAHGETYAAARLVQLLHEVNPASYMSAIDVIQASRHLDAKNR